MKAAKRGWKLQGIGSELYSPRTSSMMLSIMIFRMDISFWIGFDDEADPSDGQSGVDWCLFDSWRLLILVYLSGVGNIPLFAAFCYWSRGTMSGLMISILTSWWMEYISYRMVMDDLFQMNQSGDEQLVWYFAVWCGTWCMDMLLFFVVQTTGIEWRWYGDDNEYEDSGTTIAVTLRLQDFLIYGNAWLINWTPSSSSCLMSCCAVSKLLSGDSWHVLRILSRLIGEVGQLGGDRWILILNSVSGVKMAEAMGSKGITLSFQLGKQWW